MRKEEEVRILEEGQVQMHKDLRPWSKAGSGMFGTLVSKEHTVHLERISMPRSIINIDYHAKELEVYPEGDGRSSCRICRISNRPMHFRTCIL